MLRFRLVDTLAATLRPLPVAAVADVRRLGIAMDEDGRLYRVSLVGHVLLAGRTGSGKASVVWSILAALAGGIADGLVQVHAFDPKGGMEFAYGRPLFHAFHYEGPDTMAGALEDLAKVVNQRADRYRGRARDHVATLGEPTIVIPIDEFASLTAYVADKKIKDRINQTMAEILTKGRAVGVHVIAALQDPRKEILSYRNLFATRIALALNEESEVDMILGDNAVQRGAASHLIPDTMPGTGYVMLDGRARPARVRFPYHSDDDICALAATYGSTLGAGR
jgi:S-DNA-T family DNA segregation ATPase FtsK/SpoIIIE